MHALLQIPLEFSLKFLNKSSSIAVKYLIDVFLKFFCLSSLLQSLDAFFVRCQLASKMINLGFL